MLNLGSTDFCDSVFFPLDHIANLRRKRGKEPIHFWAHHILFTGLYLVRKPFKKLKLVVDLRIIWFHTFWKVIITICYFLYRSLSYFFLWKEYKIFVYKLTDFNSSLRDNKKGNLNNLSYVYKSWACTSYTFYLY